MMQPVGRGGAARDAVEVSPVSKPTLVLTRRDVVELLTLPACIEAVEAALVAHASGRSMGPAIASVHVEGGGFHVKAAGLSLSQSYFAAKTNSNFFHNDHVHLPRIQGVVALFDAKNGTPLALIDSIEITALRTAATTAIAARRLARSDARAVAILGCGIQGHATWKALAACRPIDQAFLVDPNAGAAASLAKLVETAGARARVCTHASEAIREVDLCVTATPSTRPVVHETDLHPGLFIAAVGADSEHKQELDPRVLLAARVIVDHREQASTIGEVHHAIAAGHVADDIIDATLDEVVAGTAPGRTSEEEIVVFDSTGTALQDVAAAALVYERALESGLGVAVDLGC